MILILSRSENLRTGNFGAEAQQMQNIRENIPEVNPVACFEYA
ncbi:MAG: hypothetical protein AAF652_06470 [Cyanobacteria bacterium P01_C01_bin.72]